MYYRFIEIGTCDFGTIVDDARDFDHGICVEPIHEYLSELKQRPNVKYLCAAIGTEDGTCDITFIPPKVYDNDSSVPPLNFNLRGSNTIKDSHHLMREHYDIPEGAEGKSWWEGYDYSEKTIKRKVPQVSVKTFVEMFEISACEILKIDIEGMDTAIMRQFCELWRTGKMDPPSFITYEDMENDEDLKNMLRDEFKYVLKRDDPFGRTFVTQDWIGSWG